MCLCLTGCATLTLNDPVDNATVTRAVIDDLSDAAYILFVVVP